MGRGKSGTGRSGGGGAAARGRYDAAKSEAEALVQREMSKPNGQRWEGDSYQQYTDARRRQADAGSEYLLSHVTDSMIERAMDRYIDDAIKEEGVRKTQGWVKVLAGTKKDGSPTLRARENARLDRADDIARALGNSLGVPYSHTGMSKQQHDREMDRMAEPIMRAARRRMRSGSLK